MLYDVETWSSDTALQNSCQQVQKVNYICGFLSEAAGDPEHLHGGRDWNSWDVETGWRNLPLCQLHEYIPACNSLSLLLLSLFTSPSPFPLFSPLFLFSSLLFSFFLLRLFPLSFPPLPPLLFYLFSSTSLSSLIPSSSTLSPLPLSAQLRDSTTYLRHSTLPRRQCSTQQLLSTLWVTDR